MLRGTRIIGGAEAAAYTNAVDGLRRCVHRPGLF
jgi:hypothetical protein